MGISNSSLSLLLFERSLWPIFGELLINFAEDGLEKGEVLPLSINEQNNSKRKNNNIYIIKNILINITIDYYEQMMIYKQL